MNSYKVAVVEDERESAEILLAFFDRYSKENGVEVKAEVFESGVKFLENYTPDFDVVFLDIEMPVLNGMQTAKELRLYDESVVIVFVTNMAQYAINGYEVEALDFILKPVAYFSFSLKLKKAFAYSLRRKDTGICLETVDGPLKLRLADIYYLETEKHYIIIHSRSGTYKMRASMAETEQLFSDKDFARCNTSYLVNLAYVSRVQRDCVQVGDFTLPISRPRRTQFLDAITRYSGGNKID